MEETYNSALLQKFRDLGASFVSFSLKTCSEVLCLSAKLSSPTFTFILEKLIRSFNLKMNIKAKNNVVI